MDNMKTKHLTNIRMDNILSRIKGIMGSIK